MTTEQVYVVTSGEYSDYNISSIWLTEDEARTAAAGWGRVEIWAIGTGQRTVGAFHRSAQIDATTGEVHADDPCDSPEREQERVSVLCWPTNDHPAYKNQIGIRVTADTQERADKVFSEVRARVLADISLGLPMETIADSKYTGKSASDPWESTR